MTPSTHLIAKKRRFADYLRLMHHRAHEIVHSSCFIIFESKDPNLGEIDVCHDGSPASNGASDAIPSCDQHELSNIREGTGVAFFAGTGKQSLDDIQNRYIQFSFERDWFCLDMPNTTLRFEEAQHILRERTGFFYLKDRPQFTLHGEDVEGHEPFRKIYVQGEEDAAADDMAYILFELWKLRPDAPLYVTASAFGENAPDFEHGECVD